MMISQSIKFKGEDYETIKTFVNLLKKDATELGFENYKEISKDSDKEIFFGCRVNYCHRDSDADIEIRMFSEIKSGNIIIFTTSCITYDKAIKAIQAATGLENLLQ
jgi:hypothetical protein